MNKLTAEQIAQLTKIVGDIPALVKKMGKDGEQIKAFWDDAQDALKEAKSDLEKTLTLGALMTVMLVAKDCTRKWSFDPFKPLRIKCDDVARLLNFERYKKLRNL